VSGMDEPTPEFSEAIECLTGVAETACQRAVIEFAKYVAKNWKMTEAEWRMDFADEPPTGTYWDGYNAAMDGMLNAAELFTGSTESEMRRSQ
jgi:hypothetical protein